MTKITFYGVVDEIGGNKILIEDGTKKGIAEDFIEKAERTQIMATIIFASFAFFAVRFLYYPNKSEIFNLFWRNSYSRKINHRVSYELRFINEHERVSLTDSFIPEHRVQTFFSVYSVISVVFQIKK